MKNFFSNLKKLLSIVSSLFFIFMRSGILIFSISISNQTLDRLASSKYFQSKVLEVFEKNNLSPEGVTLSEINGLNDVEIRISQIKIPKFTEIVAQDIYLKVDLVKYILGFSFINEISIGEIFYNFANGSENQFSDRRLELASAYLERSIESINS